MRQKTYFSPGEQLRRTVEYAMEVYAGAYEGLDTVFAAEATQATRWFNAGDILLFQLNNGQGQRWPVTAVTSKGRRLSRLYVQFKSYFHPGERHTPCWWHSHRNIKRRYNGKVPLIEVYPCGNSYVVTKYARILYSGPDQMISLRNLIDGGASDPASWNGLRTSLRRVPGPEAPGNPNRG